MENFTEHQIRLDEYITGNRFIDICQDTAATFCKTDYIARFHDTSENIFVTHNSDYHIDQRAYQFGPECKLWLAQNKNCDFPNLEGIPIGLENMQLRTHEAAARGEYSSQVRGALEKALLIDKYNAFEIDKSGLVYMNFNIKTFPSERQLVWDMFKKEDWVTSTQDLPLQQFYFDLASYKFVISPRGNGTDCHRTWEALYLRTIPIVKRSHTMNEFKDLPIYYVDDWSEISYTKLNEYYEAVQGSLFDLSKLKISAWRQYINERLSV